MNMQNLKQSNDSSKNQYLQNATSKNQPDASSSLLSEKVDKRHMQNFSTGNQKNIKVSIFYIFVWLQLDNSKNGHFFIWNPLKLCFYL